MAQIVAAMALTHAPGVRGWLGSAPEHEQQAILAGYAAMYERLQASAPDLIIGIANDHMLNMPIKDPPDFCVGTGALWKGPAEFFREWLNIPEYNVSGAPALAIEIKDRLQREGVNVTSADELLFDDNWSVPLSLLTPEYKTPFIPIQMNCINPPIPGPERSFVAGTALANAIREDLPDGLRVAVIGTGGLSHEPGGKRYFQVDEEFDRWFLDLLATKDTATILQEATVERMEEAGGGGTAELMAWIVAMAAGRGSTAEPIFYVPSVEMRCGIGGVIWNP